MFAGEDPKARFRPKRLLARGALLGLSTEEVYGAGRIVAPLAQRVTFEAALDNAVSMSLLVRCRRPPDRPQEARRPPGSRGSSTVGPTSGRMATEDPETKKSSSPLSTDHLERIPRPSGTPASTHLRDVAARHRGIDADERAPLRRRRHAPQRVVEAPLAPGIEDRVEPRRLECDEVRLDHSTERDGRARMSRDLCTSTVSSPPGGRRRAVCTRDGVRR
jgi:hypothetical protein